MYRYLMDGWVPLPHIDTWRLIKLELDQRDAIFATEQSVRRNAAKNERLKSAPPPPHQQAATEKKGSLTYIGMSAC